MNLRKVHEPSSHAPNGDPPQVNVRACRRNALSDVDCQVPTQWPLNITSFLTIPLPQAAKRSATLQQTRTLSTGHDVKKLCPAKPDAPVARMHGLLDRDGAKRTFIALLSRRRSP